MATGIFRQGMELSATIRDVAAAAAMTAMLTSAALAQNKQVYFLSWGGTVQTMLEKEGWAETFKKDTGYTVSLVPKATSGEIIATAIAQKDRPQVDVVMCDLVAYLQGVNQDIFAALDKAKAPNLNKALPGIEWVTSTDQSGR